MKKFLKFLGSAAVLCATVAGGIFAYKKFFVPDPFDDDFEDDLEDEDDSAEEDTAERGYVSLTTPEEEKTEETASKETEKTVSEETVEESKTPQE